MSWNQCDGCRAGLPVKDGLHYLGGIQWIGCTAGRYGDDQAGDLARDLRATGPDPEKRDSNRRLDEEQGHYRS